MAVQVITLESEETVFEEDIQVYKDGLQITLPILGFFERPDLSIDKNKNICIRRWMDRLMDGNEITYQKNKALALAHDRGVADGFSQGIDYCIELLHERRFDYKNSKYSRDKKRKDNKSR